MKKTTNNIEIYVLMDKGLFGQLGDCYYTGLDNLSSIPEIIEKIEHRERGDEMFRGYRPRLFSIREFKRFEELKDVSNGRYEMVRLEEVEVGLMFTSPTTKDFNLFMSYRYDVAFNSSHGYSPLMICKPYDKTKDPNRFGFQGIAGQGLEALPQAEMYFVSTWELNQAGYNFATDVGKEMLVS